MVGRFVRANIVARLRAEREAGRAIYDALCGSGITAKMAARGGGCARLPLRAACRRSPTHACEWPFPGDMRQTRPSVIPGDATN
jgi:hypothetical protein